MKLKVSIIACLLLALTISTAQARVPRKKATPFDLGVQAYENQQYEQVIDLMGQALTKNPDNGYALAYKGAALRMLDRFDEAITDLGRATSLIDDVNKVFRAWTHSERFFALLERGDTTLALVDIDKAIQDNSKEVTYWRNRGIIYGRQGKYDLALADYDKALELSPDDEELINDRLQVLKTKDYYEHRDDVNTEYTYTNATHDESVVLPQFPGGNKALTQYINKKTGWSETKPPVRVTVDVLIDKEGYVRNAAIVTGYNSKLDKKALKICKELPRFSPATDNGVPVDCTIQIPVRFIDPKRKK